MGLPPELRYMIFTELFSVAGVRRKGIYRSLNVPLQGTSILQVSKQINCEARDVLWKLPCKLTYRASFPYLDSNAIRTFRKLTINLKLYDPLKLDYNYLARNSSSYILRKITSLRHEVGGTPAELHIEVSTEELGMIHEVSVFFFTRENTGLSGRQLHFSGRYCQSALSLFWMRNRVTKLIDKFKQHLQTEAPLVKLTTNVKYPSACSCLGHITNEEMKIPLRHPLRFPNGQILQGFTYRVSQNAENAITITADVQNLGSASTGSHQLVFDGCRWGVK